MRGGYMLKEDKTAITYARKSVKVKDVNEADSINHQQVNIVSYVGSNDYKTQKTVPLNLTQINCPFTISS